MIELHGVHGVTRCGSSRGRHVIENSDTPPELVATLSISAMEDFTMQHIHELLSKYPGLPQAISMDKAIRFIRITASLKRSIIHSQKANYNSNEAPEVLPDSIHDFLGSALDLSDEFVQGCWEAFKWTIWLYESKLHSSAADAKIFHNHGKGHNLGEFFGVL